MNKCVYKRANRIKMKEIKEVVQSCQLSSISTIDLIPKNNPTIRLFLYVIKCFQFTSYINTHKQKPRGVESHLDTDLLAEVIRATDSVPPAI